MRNRHGFTIVELAIAIAIMGILLVLGVAKLNESQITARDHERKTDVENIARFMEDYYKKNGGSYPQTTKLAGYTLTNFFDGLDDANLKAPGQDAYSFKVSTSKTPTINEYLYSPQRQQSDSPTTCPPTGESTCGTCTLLSHTCRSFTIYYRLEADNSVQVLESEHK